MSEELNIVRAESSGFSEDNDINLRPKGLSEFLGQKEIKENFY